MEHHTQSLELLILAAVAAFLLFKLRGVLGRRYDNNNSKVVSQKKVEQSPVPLRQKTSKTLKEDDGPLSLNSRLQKIKQTDKNFDETDFLLRARQAFEMIVVAFSCGDTKTLKPLLGKKLYQTFLEKMDSAKLQEAKIKRIKEATIIDAILQKDVIRLTIQFISDQVRTSKKQVTADDVEEHVDIWSFERKVTSSNPNWLLVKTELA